MGRAQGQSQLAEIGSRRPAKAFKCRLYRSGTLEKVADYGAAQQFFAAADAERPQDRVGRLDGLFCSPTLAGMSRWYLANLQLGREYVADPYELFYEGPEPYAYPVDAWDGASIKNGSNGYGAYWEAAVPLSRVLADPVAYPAKDWEVLVDPAYIRSARPVRPRRVIEAAPAHIADQLMAKLFHKLWFKGITYNAEAQALRDARRN